MVLAEFLRINTLFVAVNDGTTNVIIASRNQSTILVEPGHAPLAEAYCRVVVEDRQYVEIPDTTHNRRTTNLPPTHRLGPTTFFGVPLVLRDGRVVGTLCGMDTAGVRVTSQQRMLLDTMAEFLGFVFELEWQSYADALTGLGNRRYMDWFLNEDSVATETKSVVFCDMDNLKPINEMWGHAAGDQAIRLLADQLEQVFGKHGLVCRSGGDEFVVLLPGTPGRDAYVMAQQVHEALHRMVLSGAENTPVSITMGVASTADSAVGWRDVVRRADAVLLETKHADKGTVVWTVI